MAFRLTQAPKGSLIAKITSNRLLENPDRIIGEAWADGEGILVTREGGKPFVVSSPEPDEMDATEYLLSSPKNAARLRESIRQIEEGKVVYKTMEELEAMTD